MAQTSRQVALQARQPKPSPAPDPLPSASDTGDLYPNFVPAKRSHPPVAPDASPAPLLQPRVEEESELPQPETPPPTELAQPSEADEAAAFRSARAQKLPAPDPRLALLRAAAARKPQAAAAPIPLAARPVMKKRKVAASTRKQDTGGGGGEDAAEVETGQPGDATGSPPKARNMKKAQDNEVDPQAKEDAQALCAYSSSEAGSDLDG